MVLIDHTVSFINEMSKWSVTVCHKIVQADNEL